MARKFTSFAFRTMFLATMAFASMAFGRSPEGISAVPYRSIAPLEESTIERTAVVIWRLIVQARADIHHKSPEGAQRELGEADRLIDTVRGDLSTAVPRELIRIARKHLEYEPSTRVLGDLPGIFSSLDKISIYIPTDMAQRHLNLAKGYLEKDDKRGADKELALADRALVTIEVELPVLKAKKYVAQAQYFLARQETGRADKSLREAEKQAQALSAVMGSSLYQANRNLWLAFRNYSASRTKETGAYLDNARIYLEKSAKAGNAGEKEEAGRLSREAAGLEHKVSAGETGSDLLLRAMWEQSKALVERSAEYLAAGWMKAETTLGAENNLIEAKLHVAYAETYQVTTGEPDKAGRELDKAAGYLKKEMNDKLPDKAALRKIAEVEREVQALKANLATNDETVRARYESVKMQLSDLIEEL